MSSKKHKKLRYKMFRGEEEDVVDGGNDHCRQQQQQQQHKIDSIEPEQQHEESSTKACAATTATEAADWLSHAATSSDGDLGSASALSHPDSASRQTGIPLQPDLDQEGDLKALAPSPMTYSRSSPLRQHRLYHHAWTHPPADDDCRRNVDKSNSTGTTASTSSSDPLFPNFPDFQPNNLTRTNSTPLPLRSSHGSAFYQPDKFTGSDPGISGLSAFSPVWSMRSLSCASAASGSEGGYSWVEGGVDGDSGDSRGNQENVDAEDSGASSPGRGRGKGLVKKKKFFKLFGRRRNARSGRENPARPALSEDEREEGKEDVHGGGGNNDVADIDRGVPPALNVGDIVEIGNEHDESAMTKTSSRTSESATSSHNVVPRKNGCWTAESAQARTKASGKTSALSVLFSNTNAGEQYDDPGVELACSSSSDENDFDNTELKGHYHLLDEDNEDVRPPSVEPGIEVTTEMISTPATLEASPIAQDSPASAAESSPAYHPLADETENEESGTCKSAPVHVQLNYKLPKQVISSASLTALPSSLTNNNSRDTNAENSSNRHSSQGSPSSNSTITPTRPSQIQDVSPSHSQDSRLSSSTSRTARQSSTPNTAHTDSSFDYEVREANRPALNSSSSYRNREELEVEHDGNATVFSSSTTSSHMYSYINSPRPLREGATIPVERYFAGGNVVMSPTKRDGTHSPHTVSSASVSNTSSSGSDSHTPLKFVAYANARQNNHTAEEREPPANIIQPRIQNPLPPRSNHNFANNYLSKPPRSPDRLETLINNNPNSTPMRCRTPPTRNHEMYCNNSGANTPCSPPVIVDQDTVIKRNLENKSGTVRPNVVRGHSRVRGKSSSLILIPPSGSPSNPVRTQMSQAIESPIRNNLTVVVGESANDGAQEVFTAPVDAYPIPMVSPDGGSNSNNDSGNYHRRAQLSPRKLIPRVQHRRFTDDNGGSEIGEAPFDEQDTAQFSLRMEASNPSTIDGSAMVSPEK